MASRQLSLVLRGGVMSSRNRLQTMASASRSSPSSSMRPYKRRNFGPEKYHEETDLVFDDGVAPEMLIDMDPILVPASTALKHLLLAFGCFGVYGLFIKSMDPESHSPVVPRSFPYDNLQLERGGDKIED